MKTEHVLFPLIHKEMSATCHKLAITHPVVVKKNGLKNNWMQKLDLVNRPLGIFENENIVM